MTTFKVDQDKPLYRDPARTVDDRVEDLLARMTVDEKVAQLGSRWVFELAGADGRLAPGRDHLLQHGIGQVTRISGASSLRPEQAAELANALQRHLVDETRLGIPAIAHEEICSGLMARDATIFPQAIGLASTWEPTLVEALADTIRTQMRATGLHQGLGPVLDVCRDPRWGRLEETFGEDPYLVGRMGVAFVRGLQGEDIASGVVATAKHLVGYGASEGGMNWAPPHIGARELRDVYLHPFEAAVRTTRVRSVMNAYNELDGIPCAADSTLLTTILRDEWGFEGCVVSDYFSIRQILECHQFAVDAQDAGVKALEAGMDVELPSSDCYGELLLDAVDSGLVSTETLDLAVRRVLRTKFALGLFEQPFVDTAKTAAASDTGSHRELARDIARKSLVLLRNDGTLPLRTGGPSVALIGPCADDVRNLFGDYAYPAHVESIRDVLESGQGAVSPSLLGGFDISGGSLEAPTVLDALRTHLGEHVRFEQGCEVGGEARDGFEAAVELARSSDVAVMVMGDKSGLTSDCTSGESRDVSSLELPGVQAELVAAVAATGTPVVLVLVAGRPYGGAALHEQCAAVLLAWLPGQEGAAAIAETLVGVVSPGGKLPITYPRSSGQIPVFYGHKISGGISHWKGDYVDGPAAPLYPFGYGLSYTSFALEEAAVRQAEVSWAETITVDVKVTNTGDRAGDEVAQLYVRRRHASVTRPVLELKSFVRVELAAGDSRRVTFDVPVAQLGFHGRDLDYVVEPGVVELLVGTSSAELVRAGSVTIVADASVEPPAKAFDGWVTVE
ncbi:MAG TPA: glycoside hydrolase family 3 N-terminal domain-containing protein [Gaiellaceae bacterium]